MSTSDIAIAGGTGRLGCALALRLNRAGRKVLLGSRDPAKAAAAARALAPGIEAGANAEVAARAGIIFLTVPYAAQEAVLREIRAAAVGKLVIDTTVPLVPPKVMRVQLPAEGSAAQRARALLDPRTRVVSAFHNVAAHKLAAGQPLECDVLVFGAEKEERARVIELAALMGVRALHGGALENSAAAEALTSVLIFINKHYAVDGAGIRITGPLAGSG